MYKKASKRGQNKPPTNLASLRRAAKLVHYYVPSNTTVFDPQTYEDYELHFARKQRANSTISINRATTYTIRNTKNGKQIKCKQGKLSKLLVPKGPDPSFAKAKTHDELKHAKQSSRYELARKIGAQPRKDDEVEKEINGYLPYIPKGKDGKLKKFRVWTRNPHKIKEKQPKKKEKEAWQIEYYELKKFKSMLSVAMGMLIKEGTLSREELTFIEKEFLSYDRNERKQFIANVILAMEESEIKMLT